MGWGSTVAEQVNPRPAMLTPHMGAGLCSGYATSNPVSCSWPGTATEDGLLQLPSAWAMWMDVLACVHVNPAMVLAAIWGATTRWKVSLSL